MACAEQPLKKRRLYDSIAPAASQPSQPPEYVSQPPTPPPLPHEEILTRRRNREEIRGVYECYKRLKSCIAQTDGRNNPELVEAYFSLIAASRGCTSVRRIVADLIPRYALKCPTALEVATDAIISVHNSSMTVINKGKDVDGISFQTAKSCIFGLSDICSTASLEAPMSSVIQGIYSTVFQNILTFFISSFEGNDIFQVIDKNILKIQDSEEIFAELKQNLSDEDVPSLVKLSRLRAICLLRIFFRCPRNLLASCFQFFKSATTKEVDKGKYFLRQLTRKLDDFEEQNDKPDLCTDSTEARAQKRVVGGKEPNGNAIEETSPDLKRCLLGLALQKNPSMRRWVFSKYKKLLNMSSFMDVSESITSLEEILGSYSKQINSQGSQVDTDEEDSPPSKYINQHFLESGVSNHCEISSEHPGKRNKIRTLHGSPDNFAYGFSGQEVKRHKSELDVRSSAGSSHNSGGRVTMDFETGENEDLSCGRSFVSRDLLHHQSPSAAAKIKAEGRNHFFHYEKSKVSNVDHNFPTRVSSSHNTFTSPNHHMAGPYCPQTSNIVWYFDRDPAAKDVVSASRQLWLGSLGPDASEAHLRFQVESFGPIEHFFFFPIKRFALVEYRSIIDAIRAREYLHGHFPWHVKFMDIGIGARGFNNGVAVGYSSHVFVGNISSQWGRDEVLYESRKALHKGPRMITDLAVEGALLMEFDTPDEAAAVMAHLRHYRTETNNVDAGQTHLPMPLLDGPRSLAAGAHRIIDTRTNNSLQMSSCIESPHAQAVPNSPADSCWRMSNLASLLSSLRAKYGVNRVTGCHDTHLPGNGPSIAQKEEFGVPSSTLWISLPNFGSPSLTDDDLMTICNKAHGESAVRLTRANVHGGCGWFVDCASTDAAISLLRTLRACPATFFQIEFSQSGMHHLAPYSMKNESSSMELVSPTVKAENHGTTVGTATFQLNCSGSGNPICTANTPQQTQVTTFARPAFNPPTSSWDHGSSSHHMPGNPTPQGAGPNTFCGNAIVAPFIPASVTPLAQLQGPPVQQQMFSHPPPVAALPPPLLTMPPPLPQMQPPLVPPPPPPNSPPPPPPPPPLVAESTEVGSFKQSMQYSWQGILSKSGVQYCTIFTQRLESAICKYSNTISEPVEWPAKLDMTKRTDFQHVKSTFINTPPHRREVCQLIPSSAVDHKGLHDFISYLKQRDCAGVIKIPAVKSIWARLLFVLPYSQDLCSMLSVAPSSPDCLIGLILPKETNTECA